MLDKMYSNPLAQYNHHCYRCVTHHHVVCRHQAEIEIYPPAAEVYFSNERYIDAINTQVRFHASVYNAPNNKVTWRVFDVNGGPGAGSIDATGLYVAPEKGSIPNRHTVVVVATSKHDPTRHAIAKITLLGHGPEPLPQATLELFPKLSHVYYKSESGTDNAYIDASNKHQQFRTIIRHSPSSAVTWTLSGAGSVNTAGFYSAPYFGPSPAQVDIHAQLTNDTSVTAKARIILLDYHWPGNVS